MKKAAVRLTIPAGGEGGLLDQVRLSQQRGQLAIRPAQVPDGRPLMLTRVIHAEVITGQENYFRCVTETESTTESVSFLYYADAGAHACERPGARVEVMEMRYRPVHALSEMGLDALVGTETFWEPVPLIDRLYNLKDA